MTGQLQVGAKVTVRTTYADPLEISLHRHAVVLEVRSADSASGATYLVGHPWSSSRRYGPYVKDRLMPGWDNP